MGSIGDDEVENVTDKMASLAVNGGGGENSGAVEKDPRKIARKYQIDLCKKALDENIIVCLETGSGKTLIAMLLIYELSYRIKKPQKEICVFLAPTVALVEQQARVITENLDFKVGIYCGSSKRLKHHQDWEKELEQYEVFVMTPQILLHNLCHRLIKFEVVALLIFDECHYAQNESNHPYAEIMKIFYKSDAVKLPRIFGMTASPKLGKGASISSLEDLLHAKVCSVADKNEVEQFVSSPKVHIYYYSDATNNSVCEDQISVKLEEIKNKCVSIMSLKIDDRRILNNSKKVLQRLHGNLVLCVNQLGVLGALRASRILLEGDRAEQNDLIEADGQCTDVDIYYRYLSEVSSTFASECKKDDAEVDGIETVFSCMNDLKVPFFSSKLLLLVRILYNFRSQPDMKCIIFVNRIITARSLSLILQKLRFLSSWRCDFLVGIHAGLKTMSRKTTNTILEKFSSGELNLLVATKVGEEGLDIQTCSLVIRFDLPQTVASFIQSRGRARMPQSEFAFLVDRGNPKELEMIQNFQIDEAQMNAEIASRTSEATFVDFEGVVFNVDSTGATISPGCSVSLLHRYCSKLPHDEFYNPKPHFSFSDYPEGKVCRLCFPTNAPIHEMIGAPQSSSEAAKKDVCLKACIELHKLGALTDYLLPDEEIDEQGQDSSDSDIDEHDGEDSRTELHEMLVPAVLKEPWTCLVDTLSLNSYFIKVEQHPVDRLYKNFALFVKAPIPKEAERMKLELRLDHGRYVTTELVPSGVLEFARDEILLAETFQGVCLKIILDRSDFIPDYVKLEKIDFRDSNASTFYLFLPVVFSAKEASMTVDWDLIRKCMSSPIFKNPENPVSNGISLLRSEYVHLGSGLTSIELVVDSLVYTPCKDIFYFVSDVVRNKNGYSIHKETRSHVEHYAEKFNIQLSYPNQPLLKAKQLFRLGNLLRKKGHADTRGKEEHFVELPPELCQLKIIGFSKDIGSSLSLLPSVVHRLESLLVAIELKSLLSASFPEGAKLTADRVLEALTTEKCNESFSLERLEVLGDAFLKFAVGRHVFLTHDVLDEGQLTRKRSNVVNNSNLFKLAISKSLHVYIRDQPFEPDSYFAVGRQCPIVCTKETKLRIHSSHLSNRTGDSNSAIRCNQRHHWLQKKTVADALEALIGAFIVDSGFTAAEAFLKWIGIPVDYTPSQITKICSASSISLPLESHMEIDDLEKSLGYKFRHKGLLVQAFVHPSFNSSFGGCYQRLEFLGDAVLDYLVTSYLYSVYPKLKPGQLTDLRSLSVNNDSFANIAVMRSFQNFILCDSSDLCAAMDKYANFLNTSASLKGVEAPPCPKALGDLVESSIGAILLDAGLDLNIVWEVMLSFLDPVIKFSVLKFNPIREIQELSQFHKWELTFKSERRGGAFKVEAKVDGGVVSASASATNSSRKAAKRIAAKHLFTKLKDKGFKTKTKTLEEVLRTSAKLKARLIGYDEEPTNFDDSLIHQFNNLKVHSSTLRPAKNSTENIRHSKPATECDPSGSQSTKISQDISCDGRTRARGCPCSSSTEASSLAANPTILHKLSAKSHLYEICAANCWEPPQFECFKEAGPSHMKEFVFKVIVKVEDSSDWILECIGESRSKKKEAAEHAAEGALWYLRHKGYLGGKTNN